MPEAPRAEPGFDRELSLKGIVWTGIGLALLLLVATALVWPLAGGLRGLVGRSDPPPPVLPEAASQPLPPEPRLQTAPERELAELATDVEVRLRSYDWVDEGAGVARIPVARAIEILAERGLPEVSGPATVPGAPTPPAAPEGE